MGGSGIAGDVLAVVAGAVRARADRRLEGLRASGLRRRAHARVRDLVLGELRGDARGRDRSERARRVRHPGHGGRRARAARGGVGPTGARSAAWRSPCRRAGLGALAVPPCSRSSTSGCSPGTAVGASRRRAARARRDQLAVGRQRRRGARRAASGARCRIIYGARADRRRCRDAVEVRRQREREGARRSTTVCPSCVTTRSRVGASTAT